MTGWDGLTDEGKTGCLKDLVGLLDSILNQGERKTGFVLLIYPFADTDEIRRLDYASNGDREDMEALLRSVIEKWEGDRELH